MAKKSAPRTQTRVISWSIGTPRTEKSPRYATFHIAVGPLRPRAGAHSLSAHTGYRPIWCLHPGGIPRDPRCPACGGGMWGVRPDRISPLPAPPAGAEPGARLSCSETAKMRRNGLFGEVLRAAARCSDLVSAASDVQEAGSPHRVRFRAGGGRQGRGANRKRQQISDKK